MSESLPGLQFRPLEPEEFHLASGPEGTQWPRTAVILSAWRGEKLVGRLGEVVLPHLEGLQVDPEERECSGAIAKELHRQMEEAAKLLGRPGVFVYVPVDTHQGMAAHLAKCGYKKMPLEVWGKMFIEEESE